MTIDFHQLNDEQLATMIVDCYYNDFSNDDILTATDLDPARHSLAIRLQACLDSDWADLYHNNNLGCLLLDAYDPQFDGATDFINNIWETDQAHIDDLLLLVRDLLLNKEG